MAEIRKGVTEVGCALALLLCASVAVAQNPQATAATGAGVAAAGATAPAAPATSEPLPAGPLKISYIRGKLGIEARDSTLKDILTKVAALMGMQIEIPEGASSELLPIVKLGPGPAREVLASLLSGSTFDYLIQASVTDPEGIENVVLVPRERKASGGKAAEAAVRPSPFARPSVSPSRPDETSEPTSPVPAQPEPTPAETSSIASAPPPADLPAGSQSALSQSGLSAAAISNRSGLTTEGAMSPPPVMDQQSINQQLLQMYRGRMQMQPQMRQPQASPLPSNPPSQ